MNSFIFLEKTYAKKSGDENALTVPPVNNTLHTEKKHILRKSLGNFKLLLRPISNRATRT